METIIKKWSKSVLENRANDLSTEILELHQAADDGTNIDPKVALLEIIQAELDSRQPAPGAMVVKSEPTSDTRSTDMRTLETTFKESVSVFKTDQSVNTFVNQLDNCYLNNQVAATGLEINFVRMLGSKLSDDYKTNLLQLNENERNSWA